MSFPALTLADLAEIQEEFLRRWGAPWNAMALPPAWHQRILEEIVPRVARRGAHGLAVNGVAIVADPTVAPGTVELRDGNRLVRIVNLAEPEGDAQPARLSGSAT